MARSCVDELLFHWPAVVQRAENDWARGFALSIQKQARRRTWRPSPKQLEIMQRMVTDLFLHPSTGEGDFQVIE